MLRGAVTAVKGDRDPRAQVCHARITDEVNQPIAAVLQTGGGVPSELARRLGKRPSIPSFGHCRKRLPRF